MIIVKKSQVKMIIYRSIPHHVIRDAGKFSLNFGGQIIEILHLDRIPALLCIKQRVFVLLATYFITIK